MWRRPNAVPAYLRRFSTALRRRAEDEGDWLYSSEWWGTDSDDARTVLRSTSGKGNGVVSVAAYPSSRPVSFHIFLGSVCTNHFTEFSNELEISQQLNLN